MPMRVPNKPQDDDLQDTLTETATAPIIEEPEDAFPVEAFPAGLQKAICEIADAKNVQKGTVGALLLSLVSTCVGRAYKLKYQDDWEASTNTYIVIVSETGAGKSPAQKYVFRSLDIIEANLKDEYRKERLEYEIASVEYKAKKKKEKDTEPPPELPRNIQFTLEDSTLEAAAERLEHNPKGLTWTIDELAGFFEGLDKYYGKTGSGAGKTRLVTAFDGGKWSISRKTKDGVSQEFYHASATMSLIGGIQPRLLPHLFGKSDGDQGVIQRFLFVRNVLPGPLTLPRPKISDETNDLLRRITETMSFFDMDVCTTCKNGEKAGKLIPNFIVMDDEATHLFENHFSGLATHAYANARDEYSYAVKLGNLTLRIALILHILEFAITSRRPHPVMQTHSIIGAIKLIQWFFGQYLAIRAELPAAKKAAKATTPWVQDAVEKIQSLIQMLNKIGEDECQKWRTREEIGDMLEAGGLGRLTKEAVGRGLAALGIMPKEKENRQRKYQLISSK